MKVVTYTPHGGLPDRRGFAPAIVANEIASRFGFAQNVHVTAREENPVPFEIHPSLGPIYRIEYGTTYRYLFTKLTRWDPYPLHARLAELCRRERPQVLHVHQLEFPVADFKRRLGGSIAVVVHAHAVRTYQPSWGVADRYIAVSDFTREQLIGRGFPQERVSVIHNGADTDLFSPTDDVGKQALRIALGIDRDAFVLAWVGRKQEAKGFGTYLRCLELLSQGGLNVRGLAAGPTPPDTAREPQFAEREQLRERLVRKNVLLDMPALPHAQLVNIYRASDALLFPTRFNGEQHPLVLIEALASGCLVITSAIAGIAETVKHGEHALILNDPANAEEAAMLARSVAVEPGRYSLIRQAARKLARDCYDWRISSAAVERVYFELTTAT